MATDSTAPVSVLIGATGGIGSAVARRLVDEGARLVVGARTEADVQVLADEIDADAYPLDATAFDFGSRRRCCGSFRARW